MRAVIILFSALLVLAAGCAKKDHSSETAPSDQPSGMAQPATPPDSTPSPDQAPATPPDTNATPPPTDSTTPPDTTPKP